MNTYRNVIELKSNFQNGLTYANYCAISRVRFCLYIFCEKSFEIANFNGLISNYKKVNENELPKYRLCLILNRSLPLI